MIIRVNGQERELQEQCATIGDLLSSLGVRRERVAVELNGIIVDPVSFATTRVSDGDRIEIVSFVGGG